MQKQRPVFLNLLLIKLPLSGVVSIMHRISGLLLFMLIPGSLLLLQRSLSSPESFQSVLFTDSTGMVVKFLVIFSLAGLALHFFAGIRCLLIDLHWGVSLPQARTSAKLVLGLSLLSLIATGVWLW